MRRWLLSGSLMLAVAVASAATVMMMVTADQLDLRKAPDARASVITHLHRGQYVIVVGSDGKWDEVIAQLPNSGKQVVGYAAAVYLKPQLSSGSSNYEDVNPDLEEDVPESPVTADDLDLSLSNEDFNCDEGVIPDQGFTSCSLTFDVEVDGPAQYEGEVDVHCDANFELTYLNALMPSSDSESTDDTVSMDGGSGDTSMEIDVEPSIVIDKLIKARVTDLSCEGSPEN